MQCVSFFLSNVFKIETLSDFLSAFLTCAFRSNCVNFRYRPIISATLTLSCCHKHLLIDGQFFVLSQGFDIGLCVLDLLTEGNVSRILI